MDFKNKSEQHWTQPLLDQRQVSYISRVAHEEPQLDEGKGPASSKHPKRQERKVRQLQNLRQRRASPRPKKESWKMSWLRGLRGRTKTQDRDLEVGSCPVSRWKLHFSGPIRKQSRSILRILLRYNTGCWVRQPRVQGPGRMRRLILK